MWWRRGEGGLFIFIVVLSTKLVWMRNEICRPTPLLLLSASVFWTVVWLLLPLNLFYLVGCFVIELCQTPFYVISHKEKLITPVKGYSHRHLIRQTGHGIGRPLLSKLSKYILQSMPQLSLSANGQLIISEPLSHRASCLVSVTVLVTTLKHDYGIL